MFKEVLTKAINSYSTHVNRQLLWIADSFITSGSRLSVCTILVWFPSRKKKLDFQTDLSPKKAPLTLLDQFLIPILDPPSLRTVLPSYVKVVKVSLFSRSS